MAEAPWKMQGEASEADLAKARAFDINEMEWKDWGNGVRSVVFKPDKAVTMQYWEMAPGAGANPHNHPAAQLTYVQEGFMDVTINGVKYDLCRAALLTSRPTLCTPPTTVAASCASM